MTDTANTETPTLTIEEQFRAICDDLSGMSSNARTLQGRVKDLHRSYKQACKPKKVKKHTVMHDPMNISAELLKYLNKPAGTLMTKSESMKLVSTSVREGGLQNAENKRQFTPNKKLAKVLNMSPIKTITFVELNKYLSHHFTALQQ
jgi:chromatin remodeling complex protein RSC6